MVPNVAMIIHSLVSGGAERPEIGRRHGLGWCRDHNQIGRRTQRNERLRPQRMKFHHPNLDRPGPGLAAKYADDRLPVFSADIHGCQVMEPFGRAFVDREMMSAFGLDDIAERGKGVSGEGLYIEIKNHRPYLVQSRASFPNARNRLIPPSG